mmetsp:Transcript_49392/g.82196  ORF Transcript_49392/g.82196 Transcript_49392/m.82196 type:complete len:349 (-) Transcript_49392:8-1054(-)
MTFSSSVDASVADDDDDDDDDEETVCEPTAGCAELPPVMPATTSTSKELKPERSLPVTAPRWSCQQCTFINENNAGMECAMCHQRNEHKTPAVQPQVTKQETTKVTKPPATATKSPMVTKSPKPVPLPPPPLPPPTKSASQNQIVSDKKQLQIPPVPVKTAPVKIEQKVSEVNTAEIWAQRDKAMLERKQIELPSERQDNLQKKMNKNVLKREPQVSEATAVTAPKIVIASTAATTEVKSKSLSAPPPMMEYWKTNKKHDWNENTLQKFVDETDGFIKRHNEELKTECDVLGLPYMDVLTAPNQNDSVMIDLMTDFEWTQRVCVQQSVGWPKQFDLRVFKQTVANCTL